jgi:hypothetical protein
MRFCTLKLCAVGHIKGSLRGEKLETLNALLFRICNVIEILKEITLVSLFQVGKEYFR